MELWSYGAMGARTNQTIVAPTLLRHDAATIGATVLKGTRHRVLYDRTASEASHVFSARDVRRECHGATVPDPGSTFKRIGRIRLC